MDDYLCISWVFRGMDFPLCKNVKKVARHAEDYVLKSCRACLFSVGILSVTLVIIGYCFGHFGTLAKIKYLSSYLKTPL